MKPSEVVDLLPSLLKADVPVFLWGPPGVGKSTIVRQVADQIGRRVIDVRAVTLDPVDLRGIPHVNGDGRAHWCPPSFLPDGDECNDIIFLDELAQAAPLVQSSCLQLCLDRQIGEYTLPKGVTIIAASNRQSDKAGAHKIISPLLNRFLHVDFEVSNDDWQQWAVENGVDTRILSFLRAKRELLMAFDPKTSGNAFPTPRSWEFASRAIAHVPKALLRETIAGCVGDAAAAEFMAFLALYGKLPDPETVLASPDTFKIPEGEPSVLYAMCGSLLSYLRSHTNSKVLTAYATFVTRLPAEFAAMAIRDGGSIETVDNPKWGFQIAKTEPVQAWLKENKDVMLATRLDD